MLTPVTERICVLGLGYVGLTLSATLAAAGYDVIGVDIDETIVSGLKAGRLHFVEAGLQDLIKKHLGANLHFAVNILERPLCTYIICVGTPINPITRKPVLDYLLNATHSIAKAIRIGDAVIVRSTVPVGTSRRHVLRMLSEVSCLKAGEDFLFAYVPERTVEGNAIQEIRNLPQVIGGLNDLSCQRIGKIFGRMCKELIFLPDMEHAEMVKMMDNTCRDVTFAYANQIALICDRLSLNMPTVLQAANLNYPRNQIAVPSPGVGGSCLSKDPYILADLCDELMVPSTLLRASREINERMPVWLAEKIVGKLEAVGKRVDQAKIFVMGCAFKGFPETSDLRFSTTWDFTKALSALCENIWVYDAVASDEELAAYGFPCCSIEEGFRNADVVVIINAHPSHAGLNLTKLVATAKSPMILMDCWGQYSRERIEATPGIVYSGVGINCVSEGLS